MNFSLLERIGVGALLSAWLIYGSNFLGNILVDIEEASLPAAVQEAEAPPEPTAALEEVDFASLLAIAEPTAGQRVFNRCRSCHTIDEGGRHGVGPNLHDVVGSDIATKDGFAYSGALTGLTGEWSYDNLNHFLENPSGYAPGTKMVFVGLDKAADRANVIAYLRENTQDPPPLPEPEEDLAGDEPEAADEEGAAPEENGAAAPGENGAAAPEENGAAPETEEQPPAEAAGDDERSEATPDAVERSDGVEIKVALASTEEGQKAFRKCQTCHTVEQGAAHRVGPNLYDVLDRDKATAEGYKYSSALTSLEGEWTDEDMEKYLENPRDYAPGTKMTFAGLKSADERAAVIAFLRKHEGSPPPSQ